MKKKSGFSFIEIIVAIFIFSLIMTTTSVVFAKFYAGYRKAKATQRDLEDAQSAMNLIMKTMRTSSIVSTDATSVRIYDYSQLSCIEYRFVNNNIVVYKSDDPYSGTGDPITDFCTSSFSDWESTTQISMSSGYVTGSFSAIPSSPSTVGRITISMKICPSSGTGCSTSPKDSITIQSSVSLRDYNVSEINP